jgi:hypothetical protein
MSYFVEKECRGPDSNRHIGYPTGVLSPLHAIFAYLITLFSISFLKVPRGVADL